MKNNLKLISRITAIHIFTYIISAITFAIVFDYNELFRKGITAYYMKDYGSVKIIAGPIIQLFRGVLYGVVLLLTKDSFINKKYGYLKLWMVMLILGLLNPLTISPGSIMGMVYTQLSLEFHLKSVIEAAVQSLLFAAIVTKSNFFEKKVSVAPRLALLLTILSGVILFISIVVLVLSLTKCITTGAEDLLVYAIILFIYLFIITSCKL
ncbi:MAG: hypothetical protein PHC69_05805 [Ruminiclostridium sp.]|nr:hypothetical protein [Ruminiclostridium sp.]